MSVIKIAAVSDDGLLLSNHFGMAAQYFVIEAEDGLVLRRETRAKPHHTVHPDHSQPHSHSDQLHEDMFAPIRDCQVLMVGGMGSGAHNKALAAGLEVVLAGGAVDFALNAYLKGKLSSNNLRLHNH